MTATDWAAWTGALSGLAALCWDVVKWKTSGPKLRLVASCGMVQMPDPYSSNNRYVVARVTNVGNSRTTITNMTIVMYTSWRARQRLRYAKALIMVDPSPNQPLPFKLDVGDQWTGMVLQTPELENMIAAGSAWCEVYHSQAQRPVRALLQLRPESQPTQ